jgi:hypothetical protein
MLLSTFRQFRAQALVNQEFHAVRFRRGKRRLASKEALRADGLVTESGIYEIAHSGGHREPHSAILISGEPFPDCEICKQGVSYRLFRTAPYFFHDDDFRDFRK